MRGALVEEWRDIQGYEGFYQVSSFGRVRSLDRTQIQMSSHGTLMSKRYRGMDLTPTGNGNGYLIVGLTMGGKVKNHYVHRLVADAFIENPDQLSEVNHKDYNRKNNFVNNLEWIDRQMNVQYSVINMMKPKVNSKPTLTGEKYITFKKGKYRFSIKRKGLCFDRIYDTLDEAIAARVVMIGV